MPKIATVTLSQPLTIDGRPETIITVRKPKAGELRGLKLIDLNRNRAAAQIDEEQNFVEVQTKFRKSKLSSALNVGPSYFASTYLSNPIPQCDIYPTTISSRIFWTSNVRIGLGKPFTVIASLSIATSSRLI